VGVQLGHSSLNGFTGDMLQIVLLLSSKSSEEEVEFEESVENKCYFRLSMLVLKKSQHIPVLAKTLAACAAFFTMLITASVALPNKFLD
jgi:hypothetical protein